MFDPLLSSLNVAITYPVQYITKYIESNFNSHINNTVKLGLSNNGSLCWLNSSLILLFLLASDNDINTLKKNILESPNSNISIIRKIFCEMWEVYHYYEDSKLISENKLNRLKNNFIESLHQLIKADITYCYGLEEIFKDASNKNAKQDANLFLMSIVKILKLDNPQHNVTINTYITGFLYDYRNIRICRKIPVGNPIIIHVTQNMQCKSIDESLQLQNKEIVGDYSWNNNELYQEGIITAQCQDTKIPGSRFEKIEADITNLTSFIMYFSLNSLNLRDIQHQKESIINMMFSQTVAHTSMNITDYKSSNHQENINITPKTIICFTGGINNAHYICLTIENNLIFMHNDEKVTCISDNNNKQIEIAIKEFLINSSYTPYAALYQRTPSLP